MNMVEAINIEFDIFEQWINERPKWLQSAAEYLISNRVMPDEAAILHLVELCEKEAQDTEGQFTTITAGSLNNEAIHPSIRINKIANISGVGAIKPESTLSFGESHNLSVIFGSNGTGKSSYSRLLKKICGSKFQEDIFGNIFHATQQSASAEVEISIDATLETLQWSHGDLSNPFLRHAHIFDSRTAQMYMGRSEATYEPHRMRFISALIKICDKVSYELSNKKSQITSSLPRIPNELINSNASQLLKSLSSNTSIESIQSFCTYTEQDNQKRINIEAALASQDIPAQLNEIRRSKTSLEATFQYIENLKKHTSLEFIDSIMIAKNTAEQKRRIASTEASRVFSNAELNGIGQPTWISLWTHAKAYSEALAYPEQKFPFTGDQADCVLCQQPLTESAKQRLIGFEEFIQNGLENDAKNAESERDVLLQSLQKILKKSEWQLHLEKITSNQELIDESFGQLNLIINQITQSTFTSDILIFDWSGITNALELKHTQISEAEVQLITLQDASARENIILELKSLQSAQWLHHNKTAILAERERLIQAEKLENAIKLCNTTPLTRKKNELATSELTANYIQRFKRELNKLGGSRIPVEPESKSQGKGKIAFDLTLQGKIQDVPTQKILSEGEARIVSLAAFLADTTGSGQKSPFIFDDPISSLDHDFEEKVVNRLIELSHERQVIIFTHRLSLLALVQSAEKTAKDIASCTKTPVSITVHVENISRFANAAGIVSHPLIRNDSPDTAINKMLSKLIPELESHINTGDIQKFERDAYHYCSEFRIQVEKCVEDILLNKVVTRFRRSVQTQGRLPALAKIQLEDCEFIDDLMTRYSVFEHSQTHELPTPLPDILMIKEDTQKLSQWIKTFKTRSLDKMDV